MIEKIPFAREENRERDRFFIPDLLAVRLFLTFASSILSNPVPSRLNLNILENQSMWEVSLYAQTRGY